MMILARGRRGALLAAMLVLAAASAFADGGFVWNGQGDLHEPAQKAVILHLDGVEDLILQVKYEGEATDFAWVVPLPAPPTISALPSDAKIFGELSWYTRKRLRLGMWRTLAGSGDIQVVERKHVGVYDVAVLKGDSGAALVDWLSKAGFAFPKDRTNVLDHYVKRGWVFAAARIHPDDLTEDTAKQLRRGTLQPMQFTFATDDIVYPLHISSINAGRSKVLVYILARYPVAHPWFFCHNAPGADVSEKVIARHTESFNGQWFYRRIRAHELPACRRVLGRLGERRLFLTRAEAWFTQATMHDDVIFRLSPGREEQEQGRRSYAARTSIQFWMDVSAQACLPSQKRLFEGEGWGMPGYATLSAPRQELIKRYGKERRVSGTRAYVLPDGWFDELGEYEGACLLKRALVIHNRAKTERAAAREDERALARVDRLDQLVLAACLRVLGKSTGPIDWQPPLSEWETVIPLAEARIAQMVELERKAHRAPAVLARRAIVLVAEVTALALLVLWIRRWRKRRADEPDLPIYPPGTDQDKFSI
jgi:uncharacterized protein DUF2330